MTLPADSGSESLAVPVSATVPVTPSRTVTGNSFSRLQTSRLSLAGGRPFARLYSPDNVLPVPALPLAGLTGPSHLQLELQVKFKLTGSGSADVAAVVARAWPLAQPTLWL